MKTKITTDTKLESEIAYFENINLKLESGDIIHSFKLAFKTYGKLNVDKTNAILVCHALTGDQYVAGNNPITGREGWWSRMVGPNKPIDTNKFFVICSNVLGGCAGSTGPKELQNGSDVAYGGNFPSVTIKDMVKTQSLLIESLNIEKLFSVIGGSMGAMQALQWAIDFPDKILNFRYPQIGVVIIEDNVEIGSGSTIDRGSLSNTVIGKNTFLDNQIHVAHNVKIGENCIIALL